LKQIICYIVVSRITNLQNELDITYFLEYLRLILLHIILLFVVSSLFTKENTDYLETKKYSLGIYGATTFNSHQTDFKQLVGIPNCCNGFKSGNALGLNPGLVYQHPLTKTLELDFRTSLLNLSGDLISTQEILIDDNQTAVTEHLISSDIRSVGLDIGLNYYLFDRFHLKSSFNYSFIYSGTYEQEERLIRPTSFGTFENGLRVRNEIDGNIPELNNSYYSGNIGVGYSLELNEKGTYLLVPEFGIRFGLGNINSQSWVVNQITFGVSLLYNKSTKGFSNPITPYD